MNIAQLREQQQYSKAVGMMSWTRERYLLSTVSLLKDFIGDIGQVDSVDVVIKTLDNDQYRPLVGIVCLFGDDATLSVYADVTFGGETFAEAISLCELPTVLRALCDAITG